MTRVELTLTAERDLLGIVDFLSDSSLQAGERFVSAFEASVRQLREFPESGHAARFRHSRGRRVLHLGDYTLIYEVNSQRVLIRRIVSGRRRPGSF